MSIANAVGNPLRVDPKNLNGTKLNYAHVCVELDVAAPLVDSIWVGFEEDDSQIILDGIWIKVIYDVIPPLLSACYHLGHVLGMCKRGKLEVTHSLGAGSESMVGADKVFDTLSQRESATSRTEGQGVGKVFDKRPHTRKTTAPQPGRKPGSFGTQPGTKELTLRGWKAVQNLDLTNVDLGGKQGTMNKALKTPVLGANETSSTAQCHCSGSDSSDQVARIVVEPKLTETKEQPGTRGVMCDEPSSFTEAEDHGLQINVKSVSEGKNGSEDSGSLVADQVLDNLPQPGKSPKSAHSEVHSVLFYGKAESYKEVSQPEEESVEAKVFVNLTQSSPQSDPPSGNSAGTFLEATTPEVATGFFSPVMQQVEDPSADLEVGIKYICSTVETSDVTTNNPQFHTPNLKWVEVPKLLGKSPDNGIIQGKYRGTDLISCKKKVDSFIKDVEDLWGQIDKADSTTISRIGESPATKVFLKTHFERCNFNPLPITDLMDNEVIQDPCTKFELPTGGQTTNMVSQDQGHLVTVLPKLCYEQVSKSQGAQKWRTTVQIAPISEGLGIVRAALLQLEDKERVTEMRGQRLPFDDKG